MLEMRSDPSPRELCVFGFLLGLFFGVLGGMALWKTGSPRAGGAVWASGGVLTLAYAAVPALRWPVYMAWMWAAYPAGWVVSHLVFAVIFYGAVTPFGLCMRLLGRDTMQGRSSSRARSYWMQVPRETSRYFKQS